MTYGARNDVARLSGSSLRPRSPGDTHVPCDAFVPSDTDAVGEFGQSVVTRLFTAGLALNSALARIRDGPAADRVRHAVDEIDEAIRELRLLMLALPGPATGASRTGSSVRPESPNAV